MTLYLSSPSCSRVRFSVPPPLGDSSQKNVKFTLSDASRLIFSPLPRLESALRDAKGGGLERALLEVVVSKTVATREEARRRVSVRRLMRAVSLVFGS